MTAALNAGSTFNAEATFALNVESPVTWATVTLVPGLPSRPGATHALQFPVFPTLNCVPASPLGAVQVWRVTL
ncbi:MAG: hypothetical protein FWE64_04365, partial [Alphaproteobacteria bacterium]|nr:hypothetical protein [Alphaproteobacteria bacterium]